MNGSKRAREYESVGEKHSAPCCRPLHRLHPFVHEHGQGRAVCFCVADFVFCQIGVYPEL